MGEDVHVFLDTNIALHFRRADQIDWLALTSAPGVVLVVAPVLLRELEREKVHNPSRKLRERADNTVKWLATFLRDASPPPVHPGFTLKFLDHEPQVDFGAQRLSLNMADDQLIASVLDYQAGGHQRVLVCTADIGLEAKLRSRRIGPLLLPEEFKLPAEPDPLEEELRQTQRKLQRLELRLPDLRLAFENKTGRLDLRLPEVGNAPNAPTLGEIQDQHAPVNTAAVRPWEASTREEYNRKLPEYYEAYSTYLEQLAAWEEQHARTVKMELVLSNRGLAPASDIDAVLHFPHDLELFEDAKALPKRPNPPRPPVRPSAAFHIEFPIPNLLDPGVLDPIYRGPYVERNNIRFPVGRLKHGFDERLAPFYFRFPDRGAVRSFSIDFELSAGELPDPTSGKLHFVVHTS
jgi:hypothetical protein